MKASEFQKLKQKEEKRVAKIKALDGASRFPRTVQKFIDDGVPYKKAKAELTSIINDTNNSPEGRAKEAGRRIRNRVPGLITRNSDGEILH